MRLSGTAWKLGMAAALVLAVLPPGNASGAPAVPAIEGLTAVAGPEKVTLSWPNPASCTAHAPPVCKYRTRYRPSGGAWSIWRETVAPRVFGALTAGTEHEFQVRRWELGTILAQSTVKATPLPGVVVTALAAPEGLFGNPHRDTDSITLNWRRPAAPADAPVTGYVLQDSANAAGPWTVLATITDSTASASHTHGNVGAGTTRWYRVRAVNSAGEGPWSGVVSASTYAANAPAAPTGVSAVGISGGVRLSWDATTDSTVTGWEYRRFLVGAFGPWTAVPGGAATRQHDVMGLQAGMWHAFQIRAVAGAVKGKWSASVGMEANVRPTGLVAEPGPGSLTLSWDDPGDPAITGWEYKQRLRQLAWGPWTAVPGGAGTTSFTVRGLMDDSYDFRVRAAYPDGVRGPESAQVTARAEAVRKGAPTDVPGGLRAVAGDRRVLLNWNNPGPNRRRNAYWEYRMRAGNGSWGAWRNIGGEDSHRPDPAYVRVGPLLPNHDELSDDEKFLKNGVTYRFQVRAVNSRGGGPPSAVVTARPSGSIAKVVVTPGDRKLTVSWAGGAERAWGYVVEWRSGSEEYGAPERTRRFGGHATRTEITGLAPGTTYTVRVKWWGSQNRDGIVGEASGTTPVRRAPAPGRVTGVRVEPGDRKLTVEWNAVSGADGYKVQWKSGGEQFDGAAGRQAEWSSGGPMAYTVGSLAAETLYTVRVIATKTGAPDGEPSEEVTAMVTASASAQAAGSPSGASDATPGALPVVSVSDAAGTEGGELMFAVTLDAAASAPVTVDWATADGTATAGADYAAASGALTFAPGVTGETVWVAALADGSREETETLRLILSNPSGATLGRAEAAGAITDAPLPTVLTLRADPAPAEGGDPVTVTATLDNPAPAGGTTVTLAVSGTATGADYTLSSTVIVIGAGGTQGSATVTVVDDAVDEEDETIVLDATGANPELTADTLRLRIADNDDPRFSDPMPRAWVARFGREAASHVVDAVGERLRGSPGTRMTLGGQQALLDAARSAEEGSMGSLPGESGLDPRVADAARWGAQASPAKGREVSTRELLPASSFHMASASGEGKGGPGRWSVWGRGTRSGFSAGEEGLTLDGDATTATLGFDLEQDRWLAGVALSRSTGEGSFRLGGDCGDNCAGDVESTLTGVHPYARYEVSERLTVWGMVGHGQGGMTLTRAGARSSIGTDIEMSLAAFGSRGVALPASAPGGFEVAVRSDALLTWTSSETAGSLAAAEAETSRLRLALEGSREFPVGADGVLRPAFEVGLRHDGGDAETGSGIEAGGSVRYASGRLALEVSAWGLLAHEERDYEEWGVSGSLVLSPGEGERGLSMRLGSGWGAPPGGAESLWTQAHGAFRARDFDPAGRFDVEVGYGLGVRRGLLTPYSGVSVSDAGEIWRAGGRFKLGERLSMSLEGERREGADDADHGVALNVRMRFPDDAAPDVPKAGRKNLSPPPKPPAPAPKESARERPGAGERIVGPAGNGSRAAPEGPYGAAAVLEAMARPAPGNGPSAKERADARRTEPSAPAPGETHREPAGGSRWRVQFGAFLKEANALRAKTRLAVELADILAVDDLDIDDSKGDGLFRVLLARAFAASNAAEDLCVKIEASGGDCYVVRPSRPAP